MQRGSGVAGQLRAVVLQTFWVESVFAFSSIRAILSFVDERKQNSPTVLLGLDDLSPLFADLATALGWVGAQALLLLQPLLSGWVDESAIEQAIRRLESPTQPTEERRES